MRAHSSWLLAATLWVSCALSPPLRAAVTNDVTTTADAGPGSLRQLLADALPGDTIRFGITGTITLVTDELLVTNSVRIIGSGATNLVISGNNASRVFYIGAGVTSSISHLTIRDGRTTDGASGSPDGGNSSEGGGVYNSGTLTLIGCVLTANATGRGGNAAPGTNGTPTSPAPGGHGGAAGAGGGIYNEGMLTLRACTIVANATGAGGNGGWGEFNGAQGARGGLGGNGGSAGLGGGIFNAGTLTLSACTIAANAAGTGGNGGWGGNGTERDTNNVRNGDGNGGLGGGGGSGGSGGGIYSRGTLLLSQCLVLTNAAGNGGSGARGGGGKSMGGGGDGGPGESGGSGGGICNVGTLIITGGEFCGNKGGAGGRGGDGGADEWFGSGRGDRGGAGGNGGGIWNEQGALSITACSLRGNGGGLGGDGGSGRHVSGAGGAGGGGGGLGNRRGNVSVDASTISSNRSGNGGLGSGAIFYGGRGGSAGNGGGVWSDESTMTITACTFSRCLSGDGGNGGSGNGGDGGSGGNGGGIAQTGGALIVTSCTLTGNSCGNGGTDGYGAQAFVGTPPRPTGPGGFGGGIATVPGSNAPPMIRNSLIALNSSGTQISCCFFGTNYIIAPGPDLAGVFASQGHNLIGAGDGSTGLVDGVNGDLVGTTNTPICPLLGPLQDNGGPVFMHALLAGSPAIDAGTNHGLAFDARGQPRTVDHPEVPDAAGSDGTDIGAFEVNPILTGTEVRRSGDDMEVRFTTVSDKTYGVESRSEASAGAWTTLPGIVNGTGGIATYTHTNAAALPRNFYRCFER